MQPVTPELVLIDPEYAWTMRRRSTSRPFGVVFVCSGNRFRSVVAEAVFRAAVDGLPVLVESYGTLVLGSIPPLPEAAREAKAYGLDISRHLARSLQAADLGHASLVIGFEVQHLAAAAEAGAPLERSFLLRELLNALQRTSIAHCPDPIEHALATIARAHLSRAVAPPSRFALEIEDPVGPPETVQRLIARAVSDGAATLARQLFGREATAGPQAGSV